MIDPRAESTEKLIPTAPLPHISRRALKRVKNPLPVPTACPYCDGQVVLLENYEVYHGRSYGDWPYVYACKPCKAHVGLHPDTDIPLGTLADKDLREARKSAKKLFQEWSSMYYLDRTSAYKELALKMGISTDVCHFGWFNLTQCFDAENHCFTAITQKVNF